MASVFLVVIGLGWFFSYYFQNPSILIIFAVFAIVLQIVSYWYSDKIVLTLAGAHEATRAQYFDLYTTVENLSITAGLPMPKLYVVEDPAPNAFATGRDKNHAVVCVTTGLLPLLEKNELEGVIAHELSHIGNRDMLVSTVVVVLVGFITLMADMFLRSQLFGGGGDRDRGDGRVQGILMIVGLVLMILSPIIATLIQLSISRKREYLADASGALLTRYPEGLASALEKISAHSGKMKKANHATAHLFISNPFGSKIRGLFSTHPPVEKRVELLRKSI
jgi:heat shock protein HtpX